MKKLTIEQLLFAHKIGATHYDTAEYLFITENQWYNANKCKWENHSVDIAQSRDAEIDFSPLYDWIEHDGGECPVLPGDAVSIRKEGMKTGTPFDKASDVNWESVVKFKLMRRPEENWSESDEKRSEVIGQNGNTGEHYETVHDVSHHKREDGSDLIDDWWNEYPPEVARILMWEQVRKYMNRLGKKDPVHIEVAKMADYLRRWDEKERELAGVDSNSVEVI